MDTAGGQVSADHPLSVVSTDPPSGEHSMVDCANVVRATATAIKDKIALQQILRNTFASTVHPGARAWQKPNTTVHGFVTLAHARSSLDMFHLLFICLSARMS